MSPTTIFAVALGGAMGSVGRLFINLILPFSTERFAWATFMVNMAGCLAIGICMVKIQDPNWKLIIVTGLLGGFTTFSGFGYETFRYMQDGQTGIGVLYILLSVILGTILVLTGNKLSV
jgi:fluoride exporter